MQFHLVARTTTGEQILQPLALEILSPSSAISTSRPRRPPPAPDRRRTHWRPSPRHCPRRASSEHRRGPRRLARRLTPKGRSRRASGRSSQPSTAFCSHFARRAPRRSPPASRTAAKMPSSGTPTPVRPVAPPQQPHHVVQAGRTSLPARAAAGRARARSAPLGVVADEMALGAFSSWR